jgi:heme exporter protein D
MIEFLNMGGYAFYVWSAYGISLVVLMLNIILPIRREKALIESLLKRQQREAQR